MNIPFELLKQISPEQIDSDQLVDIGSIEINPSDSVIEKARSFLRQIQNPYLYRCGKIVVKVSYADTAYTLEDRLEQYIRQRHISEKHRL